MTQYFTQYSALQPQSSASLPNLNAFTAATQPLSDLFTLQSALLQQQNAAVFSPHFNPYNGLFQNTQLSNYNQALSQINNAFSPSNGYQNNANNNLGNNTLSIYPPNIDYRNNFQPENSYSQPYQTTQNPTVSQNEMTNSSNHNSNDINFILNDKSPREMLSQNEMIEMILQIEETQQMYKIYFNEKLYPSLQEYNQYLSETLSIPGPQQFIIRICEESGKQSLVTNVKQFKNGQSLILSRHLLKGIKNESPRSNEMKNDQNVYKKREEKFDLKQQLSHYRIANGIQALSGVKQELQAAPRKPNRNGLESIMQKIEMFNQENGKIQIHQRQIQNLQQQEENLIVQNQVENTIEDQEQRQQIYEQNQNSFEQNMVYQPMIPQQPRKAGRPPWRRPAEPTQHFNDEATLNIASLNVSPKHKIYPESYYYPNPFQISRNNPRRKPVLPEDMERTSYQFEHMIECKESLGESLVQEVDEKMYQHIEVVKTDFPKGYEVFDPKYDEILLQDYELIQERIKKIIRDASPQNSPENNSLLETLETSVEENPNIVINLYQQKSQFEIDCSMIAKEKMQQLQSLLKEKKTFKNYLEALESLRSDSSGKYLDAKNECLRDKIYAKSIKLGGFEPQLDWVPLPYPHKELLYSRQVYLRREPLIYTPDFVDLAHICNENVTSRNQLIKRTKRMMLERGARTNLQISCTSGQKGLKGMQLIVLCSRSGKAASSIKTFTQKNQCPFIMYFDRKSCVNNPIYNKRDKKALPELEFQNQSHIKSEEYSSMGYQDPNNPSGSINNLNPEQTFFTNNNPNYTFVDNRKNKHEMMDDIDIPGDPFYLRKYRAFHNHPLDSNMIQNYFWVNDTDIFRKGAHTTLPQGNIAIQDFCRARKNQYMDWKSKHFDVKLEDDDENQPVQKPQLKGVLDNDFYGCEFMIVGDTKCVYKFNRGDYEFDSICQIQLIQPQGHEMALVLMDISSPYDNAEYIQEENFLYNNYNQLVDHQQQQQSFPQNIAQWPPNDQQCEFYRQIVIQAESKILDQVNIQFQQGLYSLDKYKRMYCAGPKRKKRQPTNPVDPNLYNQQVAQQNQIIKVKRKQQSDLLKGIVGEGKLNKFNNVLFSDLVNSDDSDGEMYNYNFYANNYGAKGKNHQNRQNNGGNDDGDGSDAENNYSIYE